MHITRSDIIKRQFIKGVGITLMMAPFANNLLAQAIAQEIQRKHSLGHYHSLIEVCGDAIIPKTDTPGASEPVVVAFTLFAFDRRMARLDPKALEIIQVELNRRAGRNFLKLNKKRQVELLSQIDAEAFATRFSEPGSFGWAWKQLKYAIIFSYYTSEVGASKELVFDAVPGGYHTVRVDDSYKDASNGGGPF